MLSIRVNVDRDLLRRLDPGVRDGVMHGAMSETTHYLEGEVAGRAPVDLGLLRGSIASDVRGRGLGLRGEVFSNRDYAPAVERGRRPGRGFPPREPIERWAARNLGDASLWFVVARKIARQGTKGVFMFRKSAEGAGPAVERIWGKWLRRL